MKWEVHDGSRIGRFGDTGPTICQVNHDGSCQPLFQSCGPADPEGQRAALELAASAPLLRDALMLGFRIREYQGRYSARYTSGGATYCGETCDTLAEAIASTWAVWAGNQTRNNSEGI